MVKLSFNADEVEDLHHERFYHPHPRVQRKMEALYLKSRGYSHGGDLQIDANHRTYLVEIPAVRSREQVRVFLKSMSMSCRRVGIILAKADPAQQEEFLKKIGAKTGGS